LRRRGFGTAFAYNKFTYPDFRKDLLQESEMKKKDKKLKKLTLSKETLRSLEDSKLEAVLGGATSANSRCTACTCTCP
jgi:natural product precursor